MDVRRTAPERDAPSASAPAGLSEREADARRRRGAGNVAASASSRSYGRILRTNVFSFFNVILFVIGAALLALGRYNDAFTSVGLGLVNAAISAVQEIRAKRELDRLQLLGRGRVTVVRDGRAVEVPPELVVRGDVLRIRPGDQVVVDGPLLDRPAADLGRRVAATAARRPGPGRGPPARSSPRRRSSGRPAGR